MARQRSPFGAELRRLRESRSFSQLDLVAEIARVIDQSPDANLSPVSLTTISKLERERDDPASYIRPRPATVRAIAAGLGLREGDEEYQRLIAAAAALREVVDAPSAEQPVPRVRPVALPTGGQPGTPLASEVTAQRWRSRARLITGSDAVPPARPARGSRDSTRIAALRHVTRGDEAFARFDVTSAHIDYQIAFGLLSEAGGPLPGYCCQQLALTHRWLGERDDARIYADRAIVAGEKRGDTTSVLVATIVRCLLDIETNRPREAARTLVTIAARDLAALPAEDHVFLFNTLAYAKFLTGDYGACIRHAREAGRLARAVMNVGGEAEALMHEANCHTDAYSFERALDLYGSARELQEIGGDERGLAVCNLNSALCSIHLGRSESAERFLQQAEEFAIRHSGDVTRACVYHYRGLLFGSVGAVPDAIHSFHSAATLRDRLGLVPHALESRLYGEDLKRRGGYPSHDMAEAVLAMERRLDASGPDGLEDHARVYAVCIDWLDEVGEPKRADRLRMRARESIAARVAAMSDGELRRHYTGHNPWVRRLTADQPVAESA